MNGLASAINNSPVIIWEDTVCLKNLLTDNLLRHIYPQLGTLSRDSHLILIWYNYLCYLFGNILIWFPLWLDSRSSLFRAFLWNPTFILPPVSHEKRKKSSYFDLGMHLGELSLLWHDVRTLLSGVSKGKIQSYLIWIPSLFRIIFAFSLTAHKF